MHSELTLKTPTPNMPARYDEALIVKFFGVYAALLTSKYAASFQVCLHCAAETQALDFAQMHLCTNIDFALTLMCACARLLYL